MPTLLDYPEMMGEPVAARVREMLSDDWTKPLVKVYFRGQVSLSSRPVGLEVAFQVEKGVYPVPPEEE